MSVVRRILVLLIAFPAALLLVTLALANRHGVRMVLDPFRPEAPVLSLELPFYVYLFGALILGVLLGGLATWFSQSSWRHAARVKNQEARRWRAEADRLSRERDDSVSSGKQLALAGR